MIKEEEAEEIRWEEVEVDPNVSMPAKKSPEDMAKLNTRNNLPYLPIGAPKAPFSSSEISLIERIGDEQVAAACIKAIRAWSAPERLEGLKVCKWCRATIYEFKIFNHTSSHCFLRSMAEKLKFNAAMRRKICLGCGGNELHPDHGHFGCTWKTPCSRCTKRGFQKRYHRQSPEACGEAEMFHRTGKMPDWRCPEPIRMQTLEKIKRLNEEWKQKAATVSEGRERTAVKRVFIAKSVKVTKRYVEMTEEEMNTSKVVEDVAEKTMVHEHATDDHFDTASHI